MSKPNPDGKDLAEKKNSPPSGGLRTFSRVASGQEARNYDFAAMRPPGPKTNFIESVGHLIKSCLGGGVVSVHTAYRDCGLWSSIILNVFLGIAVTHLMVVLAQSAQRVYGRTHTHLLSYPDLAEAAFMSSKWEGLKKYAKTFRYAVDVTIMVDLFGSCCCYQVLIANSLHDLLEEWGYGQINTRYIIAALIIPCILICMILTLKYLAPFSLAADVVIGAIAVFTIYYGIQQAPKSPTEYESFKDMTGLLTFLGVCVFSMEGVGVTLPIENNMLQPRQITTVLWFGMAVVAAIVMLVGFFGYWGFGEDSKAPVTVNFPAGPIPTVLKIGITIMVYVTFGLNFWVPFDLAWAYLKLRHPPEKYWYIQRIYRAIFVIIISIISIIFPDVTNLMSCIGAFCLSNMGFIYPAFIELALDADDPGLGAMKWRVWRFCIILVFALFLMIFGTVSNVTQLIKAAMK